MYFNALYVCRKRRSRCRYFILNILSDFSIVFVLWILLFKIALTLCGLIYIEDVFKFKYNFQSYVRFDMRKLVACGGFGTYDSLSPICLNHFMKCTLCNSFLYNDRYFFRFKFSSQTQGTLRFICWYLFLMK